MKTLIDRYINEVGKNLSGKQREDIQAEIRSLIEDALDDRSQAEGRQPDDEMTLSVLKELGSPEKMAASYQPERYLIGPRLYPIFMLVLKIVLAVVFGAALFGFAISVSTNVGLTMQDFAKELGKAALGFGSSAMQMLGSLVVIFAIMQWAWPSLKVSEEDWDPRSLEDIEDEDAVKRIEVVLETVFVLIVMFYFNFYAKKAGIVMNNNGTWYTVKVFTETFFHYMPLFNLSWALTVGLNIILLRQGVWSKATRWLSVVLSLFSIIIAIILMSGPAILQINPQDWAAATGAAYAYGGVSQAVQMAVTVCLALVIGLNVAKIVVTIMQMSWFKSFQISK